MNGSKYYTEDMDVHYVYVVAERCKRDTSPTVTMGHGSYR
jgi:hypothetical protein